MSALAAAEVSRGTSSLATITGCPEVELLLCCARTRLDPERASRVTALLQEDLDWAYLLRQATAHGLMPLLYWHLHVLCRDAVPPLALEQLRNQFSANVGHNLFFTGELLSVLNLLRDHGIIGVPWKGPVLAALAYRNLALREFVDLDIVVRKRDALRAQVLLDSEGYRPAFRLTPAQRVAFVKYHYEYPLRSADGKILVELQWALTPRWFSFPLDMEAVWERLQWVALGGTEVPTFASEDLLLMLCAHGAKHQWGQLSWIADIATLIQASSGMDWDTVSAHAHRLGSRRILDLGLLLAGKLLDAELPPGAWKSAQADPVAVSLATQVRDQLFAEPDRQGRVLRTPLFLFRVRDRARDRATYLFRRTTDPGDDEWALLPLPSSLTFLYCFLRPMLLVRQYASRLWSTRRL